MCKNIHCWFRNTFICKNYLLGDYSVFVLIDSKTCSQFTDCYNNFLVLKIAKSVSSLLSTNYTRSWRNRIIKYKQFKIWKFFRRLKSKWSFLFNLKEAILNSGSGHVTFWNLIGRDEAGLSTEQLGDRLRATEGCFMMTDIANVESVVETAVAGKVISSCHWGNLLVFFLSLFVFCLLKYRHKYKVNS